MRINDLSTERLLHLLHLGEQATPPDQVVIGILRRELTRRLDLVREQEAPPSNSEVLQCPE